MLDVIESPYAVKSVIGNIQISQTDVFEQDQFIDAYSSSVVMNDTNITNITFIEPVIKASLSTLNGSNIVVTNINNPSGSTNFFISCSINTIINISGLTYTSSQVSLMLLNNVIGTIDNLDITSISSMSVMIQIDRSFDLQLTRITIDDVDNQADSIISITDSTGLELGNILMSSISQLAIEIYNSIIDKAYSFNFNNCYQAIKILGASTININSSIFDKIGNSRVISGGAIQVSNSNITINDSRFTNCEAREGACLALL